jgi:hypothetical protein
MLQFRRWHSDIGAGGFLLAFANLMLFVVAWDIPDGLYKLQFEKFDDPDNKQLFVVADGLVTAFGILTGLFGWDPVPGLYEGGLYLKPSDTMVVRTHPDEPLEF